MGAWERQQPVAVDVARLPVQWELVRGPTTASPSAEPNSRYLAVVGRSGLASIEVVLRIDYAVAEDGADIRQMVGSAILRGMDLLRREHREHRRERRREESREGRDDAPEDS